MATIVWAWVDVRVFVGESLVWVGCVSDVLWMRFARCVCVVRKRGCDS